MIRVHYLDLSSVPSIEVYLRSISQYPLLTRDGERELFEELDAVRETEASATGRKKKRADQDIQRITETAVLSNLRLVLNIVSEQYHGYYGILSALDLIQAGNIGLLEAVKRFDVSQGLRFSTYATYWIRKEISRGIKTYSKYVRFPEYITSDLNKVRQLMVTLTEEDRDEPTRAELNALDFKRKDKKKYFARLRELSAFEQPLSLESSTSTDGDNTMTLGDTVYSTDDTDIRDAADQGGLQEALAEVLETLSPKERAVVMLRFGLEDGTERSLEDIGNQVGCSREYARQLLKRAVGKLKQGWRADSLVPYWEPVS